MLPDLRAEWLPGPAVVEQPGAGLEQPGAGLEVEVEGGGL